MNNLLIPFLLLFSFVFFGQNTSGTSTIYISKVGIFNGKDNKITKGNILIEGKLIKKKSADPIPIDKSARTQIIDGGGMCVMPGLIDAHTTRCSNRFPS